MDIDKDLVRQVLAKHYQPDASGRGPSWLTFIGHASDHLWNIDFFRCESILLKSHWVLVVMDQLTRRIIGFGVKAGDVDGVALCQMFTRTIARTDVTPAFLSSDNDPLFLFHRWRANPRMIDVEEIKSATYTPTSHPFIERLIGTIRREYLDQILFWNKGDLERKLSLLEQCRLKDTVEIEVDGNTLVLRPVHEPRSGWNDAFAEMAKHEDDLLLDQDVLSTTAWDETEWRW